jgi:hypothetical protein
MRAGPVALVMSDRETRLQTRRFCVRAPQDLRLSWPVILLRGFPARRGSLRRFQADSGAGSARDEKKPAVVMSNTHPICRAFTGATGLEPATSGVTAGLGASGLGRSGRGLPARAGLFAGWLAGIAGRSRELSATSRGMSAGWSVVSTESTGCVRVCGVVLAPTDGPLQAVLLGRPRQSDSSSNRTRA